MNESRYDLINGKVIYPTMAEIQHEEYMTATLLQSLGHCDFACHYVEPYGWVPEADCPVHDRNYNE